jgi:amino acid transporter
MLSILRLIVGRRLYNSEAPARRIGVFAALPAMGLDALASAAYGPEAALAVLAPAGAAGLGAIGPTTAAILALLLILYVSYWQTLGAYPDNAGAYVVARANLGREVGVLAAAALMIDFVLNVAVAISAGVAALVSMVPQLYPHTLFLCFVTLAVMTLVNIRGIPDAGRLFAIPTYLFVACFLLVIALGGVKSIAGGGHPMPVVPPHPLSPVAAAPSLWLLLRAFANGCTALTGVEAVSNGMDAFREPTVRRGRATLSILITILAALLAGIAWLAHGYHIGAMEQSQSGYRSVLAQLAAAVLGRSVLYYLALASAVAVLALSANTSFTAFPLLCRQLARGGFLPSPFAVSGRRLVVTVPILYLGAIAGLLLLAFGGVTNRLIPLFAVGAFLSFTLSQAAMTVHWRAARRRGDRRRITAFHMLLNGCGATVTALALAIIFATKFVEGAWIVLLVIAGTVTLLHGVHRYYTRLNARLHADTVLGLGGTPPLVLVAIEEWNKPTQRALAFAMQLSPDVIGVHLTAMEGPGEKPHVAVLREAWPRHVEQPARAVGRQAPELCVLPAKERTIHAPFLELIERLTDAGAGRPVAVVIPQLVKRHWWQYLLHTNRASRLRTALLENGDEELVVIEVPWYFDQDSSA